MIAITNATSPPQLDAVRDLMRAFMAWHRERHTQDLHFIDAYFDAAVLEEELATLPGAYSPPSGRLLLATFDGEPAGCVALRSIDAHFCEMKRMFVYPHLQGRGIGRGSRAKRHRARSFGWLSSDASGYEHSSSRGPSVVLAIGVRGHPTVLRIARRLARLACVHGAFPVSRIRGSLAPRTTSRAYRRGRPHLPHPSRSRRIESR